MQILLYTVSFHNSFLCHGKGLRVFSESWKPPWPAVGGQSCELPTDQVGCSTALLLFYFISKT